MIHKTWGFDVRQISRPQFRIRSKMFITVSSGGVKICTAGDVIFPVNIFYIIHTLYGRRRKNGQPYGSRQEMEMMARLHKAIVCATSHIMREECRERAGLRAAPSGPQGNDRNIQKYCLPGHTEYHVGNFPRKPPPPGSHGF